MISWLKYNPASEIARVNCPILILQGSCDIQVTAKDAEALHQGNLKSELDLIPSMTHVLKDAGENCRDDNQKTYTDSTLPLDMRLVNDLVRFIKKK